MKKKKTTLILMMAVTFYIVGNNQIASGETKGGAESESSISFNQTYVPPSDNTSVPDGNVVVPVQNKKAGMLPQTGEQSGFNGQLLGLLLISLAFVTFRKNKKEK